MQYSLLRVSSFKIVVVSHYLPCLFLFPQHPPLQVIWLVDCEPRQPIKIVDSYPLSSVRVFFYIFIIVTPLWVINHVVYVVINDSAWRSYLTSYWLLQTFTDEDSLIDNKNEWWLWTKRTVCPNLFNISRNSCQFCNYTGGFYDGTDMTLN